MLTSDSSVEDLLQQPVGEALRGDPSRVRERTRLHNRAVITSVLIGEPPTEVLERRILMTVYAVLRTGGLGYIARS